MATTECTAGHRGRYRTDHDARAAAIAELYRTEGKAEIVGGKVVILDDTGVAPNLAAFAVAVSLRAHARATQSGYALTDGASFLADIADRWSFCPDASYYRGPLPPGLKFAGHPPDFAVEVRSENDYGPAAERAMRTKRSHYFAAGTLVVWDVDLLADDPVRVYRGGKADTPAATFRRGDLADAEPAVPGWRFSVDELFDTR
jgi:Uma2 family endonuclease